LAALRIDEERRVAGSQKPARENGAASRLIEGELAPGMSDGGWARGFTTFLKTDRFISS